MHCDLFPKQKDPWDLKKNQYIMSSDHWGGTKTHDKNPSPNSQIYSRLKFRLKFSEVPTSVVDKMDRLAQLPDQIHLHPDTLPCPRNLIQWFGAEETPAITPPP